MRGPACVGKEHDSQLFLGVLLIPAQAGERALELRRIPGSSWG